MTFLFQWGLPITFGAGAIAFWFFAGQIPLIGNDIRRWIIVGLVGAAAVSAIYGRGRSVGENAANQKVERNTNAAIKGGQSGARDARGCKPSELWDIGAGRCVEVGGGDRN